MNWEAIGAIGEVIAALGVVATLIFLAYQLIQTRVAIRSSAYQHYSQSKRDLALSLAAENVRSIFLVGLNDANELSEEDLYQFHQILASYMIWLQASHRMWQDEQITAEDWESDLVILQEIKGSPVFAHWWPAVQRGFVSHFVQAVNDAEPLADLGYENFVEALKQSR